jgi:dTDP-4-dehydrorhamnose reductase
MDKLKVLVLGDGLLGSEIVKQTGWDFISRKSGTLDINTIEECLDNGNHLIIINCVANTDTYSTDKKAHWDINYSFVDRLIKYCNRFQIKLVHISTDYIYAGSVNNASENDVPVHCNNWYGYTKLLADGLVQLQSENHLLIRCTHKPFPFPYDGAWIDQIGNFDYVDEIAKRIVKAVNYDLKGVYNIGTDLKTMYELAIETKDVIKTYTPAHIPKNQSMDLTKFKTALINNEGLKYNYEIPFFSIAIPTYGYNGKGGEFLEHNLSILDKQKFKNFEVIISDHSTDDTIKNIVNRWNSNPESTIDISYNRTEHGRGFISPNLNIAMRLCKGKWIKILFQDDFLYDENSLLTQYEILNANPDINWLITTFCHSNDGNTFYREYQPKLSPNIWNGNNTLGNPSNLTIKNEDLIYFDEQLNWLVDCEYYYRLFLKYGKPTIIGTVTVVNRTHGGGLTDTTSQEIKNKELEMLKKKYA